MRLLVALCLAVAGAQECEFDDSTLLQLEGTGRVNRSNVSQAALPYDAQLVLAGRMESEVSRMGRFMARVMQEGRYSNGLLLLATLLCLLLLRAEVSNVFWLQGRAAAVLAAMMLVLSNILGKALLESPEFGIGILDLVYAQCITLSFLGVAFTKFHPEKPSVIPQNAEQAVRLLCVGFFSSGSSMLIIAGMATGPVTAILLVMSLQTSFATAWKVLLGESIEPEEYVASPILLLAVAVGTAIGCQEVGGSWTWGSCLGLAAAVGRATSALQQRNFCSQMHHVVLMTYSGAIGLVMFGPIAAAYPQHARAMLSLNMMNFAPLVLFGACSMAASFSTLKAANTCWGTMSESSYTMVGGLALCLQFLADVMLLPQHWARFTQSSIALVATCLVFSYAVAFKQVLRAEQCFSTAYSLFEPQEFQDADSTSEVNQ